MSLAPINLRSISGIVGTSSLGVVSGHKHKSCLTMLSSTCCHLSNPACLENLTCLMNPPMLASNTETLSGLSSLIKLSEGWDDDRHAHAMASMYGFHI